MDRLTNHSHTMDKSAYETMSKMSETKMYPKNLHSRSNSILTKGSQTTFWRKETFPHDDKPVQLRG